MTDPELDETLTKVAGTLRDIDSRLRVVELQAAESKGLQAGLALNRRLREHEAEQHRRDEEVDDALAERPTRGEMEKAIAGAIDSSLRKWAIRVFLGLVAAAPIWIGVSITVATYIENH